MAWHLFGAKPLPEPMLTCTDNHTLWNKPHTAWTKSPSTTKAPKLNVPSQPWGTSEFHWQPCSIPSMSRPGFHLTGWLPTCMGHHHTGNHGNTKEKRHCLGHVAALIGGCEDKNRNICCCRYIANWTDGNLMTYHLYTFFFSSLARQMEILWHIIFILIFFLHSVPAV